MPIIQEAIVVRNLSLSRSGTADLLKRLQACASSCLTSARLLLPLALAPGLLATAQTTTAPVSTVPAVVVSSASTLPVTGMTSPGQVALDACGNIYEFDNRGSGSGKVLKISPAGGAAVPIGPTPINNSYSSNFGQDASLSHIYVTNPYSSGTTVYPIVNCVVNFGASRQSGQESKPVPLFYYYDPGYVAGDFRGNVFLSTNSTCCVTGNYWLAEVAGGTPLVVLPTQPSEIQTMAIDKNENIYYIAQNSSKVNTVYELTYGTVKGTTGFASDPVVFGTSYVNPIGVSVDPAGNLYITDQGAATGASVVYKVPNELVPSTTASTTPTYAVNPVDQYIISGGLDIGVPIAVNSRGDFYYTASRNASTIQKVSIGNANFGSVPLGTSATRTLNFQFNADTTPAAISLPSGVYAGGRSTCVAGTTFKAGTSCTISATFTPAVIGEQTSSISLQDANGNSISTGYLTGVGQAPSLTLDPGNVAPLGSGLKAPAGIAIDANGNTYVADPSQNSVTEFPTGGGTPIPITPAIVDAKVDLPLSSPNGVAVDGAGNVYIADTGNGRVIEIPLVKGAFSTASPIILASGLKTPGGVSLSSNGDVYIADTGDNNVLYLPNEGGTFGGASSLGTGLLAPLSTVVDSVGNLYIADSGNNQIIKLPIGAAQQTVAAGILNPSSLAVDGSDSLFVVDQGNFRILRIPAVDGVLNPNDAIEVGLGVTAPYGLAVDNNAMLYVTDSTNAAAYTLARTQVSADFGDLPVGIASGALPVTLASAGNLPLIFNAPFFTSTGDGGDFAMTSPSGICADGATLPPGTTCDVVDTFTPTASGARAATLALSSNASSSAPAELLLSGNGITLATTSLKVALTKPTDGAPFYGEPLTFTATVSSTASPTGFVSFVIDNTQVALNPVSGGAATLNLNSGLTGGTHSIYAVYKGDSANNGSTTPALSLMIAKAPTTSTFTITKVPFTNPFNARHSNLGSCGITTVGPQQLFPPLKPDPLTFVATVVSPGIGIPSGTLTFYNDTTVLGTTTVLPLSGGGFGGQFDTTGDAIGDGTTLGQNGVLLGTHNLTAVYSGDQNYVPATSPATQLTIEDVGPTTPVTTAGPCDPTDAGTLLDPTMPAGKTNPIVGLVSQASNPATFLIQPSASGVTATASTPGVLNITLSSLGGYNGVVDITCVGLPAYAACATNPGQANILPSSAASISLPTVVTLTVSVNNPPYVPTAGQSSFFWFFAALFGFGTLATRRRFAGQLKGRLFVFFGAAVLLGSMLTGLSGCGSGTSGSSNVKTPTGTTTVMVNLTAAQYKTVNYNNILNTPDLVYSFPMSLTVK